MTSATAFLVGAVFAAIICVGIVAYLKNHLRLLLIELCGTAERASFWLALCNVTLVAIPVIFVLGYRPELESNSNVIFEITGQLKSALVGIVITLGSFALVLLKFIPRDRAKPAPGPAR
ncbi:MAG TPA: hypothetical protein VE077_08515 [Candidatus Methylomirabilis sp.]|nr:hypothetical protein [Candidatus Methylomirabilis sp.]